MVKNAEDYDVIATTNAFGDIIAKLTSVLQGGTGVAAGRYIKPDEGNMSDASCHEERCP